MFGNAAPWPAPSPPSQPARPGVSNFGRIPIYRDGRTVPPDRIAPSARSVTMCLSNGRAALVGLLLAVGLAGCGDQDGVAPTASGPALSEGSLTTLAAEVRALT